LLENTQIGIVLPLFYTDVMQAKQFQKSTMDKPIISRHSPQANT